MSSTPKYRRLTTLDPKSPSAIVSLAPWLMNESAFLNRSNMAVQLVAEQTITVGVKVVVEGPSPSQQFGVVFEDDGDTGYLYGLDFSKQDNPILDAMHIYNVAQVSDRHKPSQVQLVWSNDGLKAALLINKYAHAIFDFQGKRGYCRTGFPPSSSTGFSKDGHEWDDAAKELFR